MDKKQMSQKEYLKKYLSSGKDKKKVKKKKPNLGSKTVKIIDDDIDLKNMRAIEDGEFDIYANTEDGPQIAGIVDERGPVDFSDKKRWKIITDDGYGDISVTSVARDERIPQESRPGIKATSYPAKDRSHSPDSDYSPPRRSGKNSDPEELRKKKSSSKNNQQATLNPPDNHSVSEDSDFSPPRKSRKNSEAEGRRKSTKLEVGRGKEEYKARDEYSSNSEKKFKRKYEKERENSVRDSRRRNYNDRNSRNQSSRSPSGQAADFDGNSSLSRSRTDSYRSGRYRNEDNYSKHKHNHRTREDSGGKVGGRKEKETSSRNKRRTNSDVKDTNSHSRRGGNDSDSDLSPPRENKRKSRKIEPESSPRETKNKKKSRNSEPESSLPRKTGFKNYQEMTEETSGFGQAPVLRDRKTGRKRDLAAEAREQEEKDEKQQELEEKYAQWGRGLKQVEDREEKLNRDLYEMSKPLARYADDADLERELKAQEREGDPMLAYMKRKHKKEGKQELEKPKYNGPSMPNRFGIRPGYRWDGVDRSNGYEKKWFDAQNARKAVQEEAYKWSTADM